VPCSGACRAGSDFLCEFCAPVHAVLPFPGGGHQEPSLHASFLLLFLLLLLLLLL